MTSTKTMQGTAELYHKITYNHSIYELIFLDKEGRIIFHYLPNNEVKKDSPAIARIITELAKARGGWTFDRAFAKTENGGRDTKSPMDISAIRLRFHPTLEFGDTWVEIQQESMALKSLDIEEGTCLIDIMVMCKEEQVILEKMVDPKPDKPDKCTRRSLLLFLDLKRKPECSEIICSSESCWDTSTQKTKKHFKGFLELDQEGYN